MMKLLIVDDHPVVREGLASLLVQAEPGLEVHGAADATAALSCLRVHRDIDLVLLDLFFPGSDGLATIGALGHAAPGVAVIVFSSSEAPADVRRALAAGALGYVPKSASAETLLAALRFVMAGNIYVPPLVLAEPGPLPVAEGARLTERQVEVLRLLVDGAANKEIGRRLGLSEKTVKAHVGAILRTLNVASRGEAAEAARKAALV